MSNPIIPRRLMPIKSPAATIWLTGLTAYVAEVSNFFWGAWAVMSVVLFIGYIVERKKEREIDIIEK